MWKLICCSYLLMILVTHQTGSHVLHNGNEDRACAGTECRNDTDIFPQLCQISKGWNLKGSEWGCCGNYEGCCTYASLVCFIHDALCRCCDVGANFCGPTCKPEGDCKVVPRQESDTNGTTCLPGEICEVTQSSHNTSTGLICQPDGKCAVKPLPDNRNNGTYFPDYIDKTDSRNDTNINQSINESVRDNVTSVSSNILNINKTDLLNSSAINVSVWNNVTSALENISISDKTDLLNSSAINVSVRDNLTSALENIPNSNKTEALNGSAINDSIWASIPYVSDNNDKAGPQNGSAINESVWDNIMSVPDSMLDNVQTNSQKISKLNESMCVHATAVSGQDSDSIADINNLQQANASDNSKLMNQTLKPNDTSMPNGCNEHDSDIKTVEVSPRGRGFDKENTSDGVLEAFDRNEFEDNTVESELTHSNITEFEVKTAGKDDRESNMAKEHAHDHLNATVNDSEAFNTSGWESKIDEGNTFEQEVDNINVTKVELEGTEPNMTSDTREADHLDWESLERTISELDNNDTWVDHGLDKELLDWTHELLNSTFVDRDAEDSDDT